MASASSVTAYAQIDEIIITAEKRESSVQSTPIAISAFDSDMMDTLGISAADDVANFTPGMSYNGGTYTNRINIRGIGRVTNELGADPGVAVYSDGIYTSETAAVGAQAILTERVEVLRGPQGTLYGRNAMGGAVNIISKRPTEDFEGEVRANVGNFNMSSAAIALSGPITDTMGYRVAVIKTNQDGWIENLSGDDLNDTNSLYYEAQLDWDIGENLNIWLKYSHLEYDQNSGAAWPGVYIDDYDTGSLTYGSLNINPWRGWSQSNPAADDPHTVDYDHEGYLRLSDNHQYTAHITYEFDNIQFKYVGGHAAYNWETEVDWDASSNPDRDYLIYIQEDKDWQSHEFQLASTNDSDIQWIAGYYRYEENMFQPFIQMDPDHFATPFRPYLDGKAGFAYMGQGSAVNPDGNVYKQTADLHSEAWALFGQVDFQVNDEIHLSGGLRYSHDEKTGTEHNEWNYDSNIGYDLVPAAENPAGFIYHYDNGSVTQNDSWNSMTGRIQADYKPDDDTMYYAWVGTGYKSGGFKLGNVYSNLTDPDGPAGPLLGEPEDVVEPEHVTAYEIGYKKTWNDTFRLNLAAYKYDYQDLQIPTSVFVSGIRHTIFVNADKAESLGFEAEATWAPTEALSLLAIYSFQSTELVDQGSFAADSCGRTTLNDQTDANYDDCAWEQDVNGNDLLMSPPHKFTGNMNYTWFRDSGNVTLGTTMTFTDSMYYSIFNDKDRQADSWTKWDASLSWSNPDEDVRIKAWVRNAGDQDIIGGLSRTDAAHGNMRIAAPKPPRMYGVEVTVNF
jgi:iron complex outermembrane receptor protein